MIFNEEPGNLFDVDKKYYLVHCVSTDCALGTGIAIEFQKRFHLRDTLKHMNPVIGNALLVGRTFNLFTKKMCYNKPTYNSLKETLVGLKFSCEKHGIKYLAMPCIGCGLDKLNWEKVSEMIQEVFNDTDIEIIVRKNRR